LAKVAIRRRLACSGRGAYRGRVRTRGAAPLRAPAEGYSREGIGAFLSHQIGYDLSRLPERFTIEEINAQITATNASPVGFMNVTRALDPKREMSRGEFYQHMTHHTASYDQVIYGTPRKIADYLEEIFVATGENGGFMIAHPPATPRDLLNVVDFLVPELQRRGRFRTEYTAGR